MSDATCQDLPLPGDKAARAVPDNGRASQRKAVLSRMRARAHVFPPHSLVPRRPRRPRRSNRFRAMLGK